MLGGKAPVNSQFLFSISFSSFVRVNAASTRFAVFDWRAVWKWTKPQKVCSFPWTITCEQDCIFPELSSPLLRPSYLWMWAVENGHAFKKSLSADHSSTISPASLRNAASPSAERSAIPQELVMLIELLASNIPGTCFSFLSVLCSFHAYHCVCSQRYCLYRT